MPALRCRSAAAGRFNVAPVAAGPGPGTRGAEVVVLVAMVGPVATAEDGGSMLLRPAEGEGSMTGPLTNKFFREFQGKGNNKKVLRFYYIFFYSLARGWRGLIRKVKNQEKLK